LKNIYDEFYSITKDILTKQKGTGKTFIIQSENEMDWSMLGTADLSNNPEPTDLTIQNAITFWNTIQKAIDDAKKDNIVQGVYVYHGCEVNMVKRAMEGKKTATNNVIPYTHCDLYGYSAYDTMLADDNMSTFLAALNYLSNKSNGSSSFGKKNIYISEAGIPANEIGWGEPKSVSTISRAVKTAFDFGIPYFNYWQLYDNECSVYNPVNEQCRGFWIRKPSGDLSPVYTQVFSNYPAVVVSGKVTQRDGTPLARVGIDLCNNKFTLTDANGNWQKSMSPGAGYCARVVTSMLPAGYLSIEGTSNNSCVAKSPSYEWQIAGQNKFVSCSAINEGFCDLPSDSNINFKVTYPAGCTNECLTSGAKQCSGTAGYKTCGNYDNDSCLEWSGVTNCSSGQTCSGAGICSSACIPKTCAQLGSYDCGSWDNGCGATISCGTCAGGKICNSNGQCVSQTNSGLVGGPVISNQGTQTQTQKLTRAEILQRIAQIKQMLIQLITQLIAELQKQLVALPKTN